jgi:cadmium resistance protein CadD (predicted permease)
MSGFGRWSLWIGLGLIAVAVLAQVLDLIPVTVITGLLGLLGVCLAGYDWLDSAAERANLRRRAARVAREREQGR